MYKVLGNDGNEYGPVSAEQVRQWIAENRVEKKTPVFPEGGKDWVFLESLPEFAAAFGPPPLLATVKPSPQNTPPAPASVKPSEAAVNPQAAGLVKLLKPESPKETGDPRDNSRAWWAYCLGVVSVVPPFGALVGIPALILGISGLRFLRRNPGVGGRFHAWMGIVLGGAFALGYWVLILLVKLNGLSAPG